MSGFVILAIAVAIIVVAGAAALLMRGRPGERERGPERDLRRDFGPEYDRLAEKHGDPKAVERELTQRIQDRAALSLAPLAADERARFVRTWRAMKERFVDDPRGAAQQADQLISGLLTALGYPSEDYERQLDLASVDHAYALGSYRKGRELVRQAAEAESGAASGDGSGAGSSSGGSAAPTGSTELLRGAILQYRVMFNDVLDRAGAEPVHADQR